MAAKFVLSFCVQVLIAQNVLSQCINRAPLLGPGIIGPGLSGYGPYDGLGSGCVSSTGGGFLVSSASPIAPTGLTVISENAIEGPLIVGGNLPFLATVALEGILPSAGLGAVSYGCGDGAVGIVSEGPIPTGIVSPGSYPPGLPAGAGYGPGLGGLGAYGPGVIGGPYGYGCGAIY